MEAQPPVPPPYIEDSDTRIWAAAFDASFFTVRMTSMSRLIALTRECAPAQAQLNEELRQEERVWLVDVQHRNTGVIGVLKKRGNRWKRFEKVIRKAEDEARTGRLEIVTREER